MSTSERERLELTILGQRAIIEYQSRELAHQIHKSSILEKAMVKILAIIGGKSELE